MRPAPDDGLERAGGRGAGNTGAAGPAAARAGRGGDAGTATAQAGRRPAAVTARRDLGLERHARLRHPGRLGRRAARTVGRRGTPPASPPTRPGRTPSAAAPTPRWSAPSRPRARPPPAGTRSGTRCASACSRWSSSAWSPAARPGCRWTSRSGSPWTAGPLDHDVRLDRRRRAGRPEVAVGQHDTLAPGRETRISDGAEIVLRRGRLVTLTVDGTQRQVWTTATTVQEALEQVGYRQDGLYVCGQPLDPPPAGGLPAHAAYAEERHGRRGRQEAHDRRPPPRPSARRWTGRGRVDGDDGSPSWRPPRSSGPA